MPEVVTLDAGQEHALVVPVVQHNRVEAVVVKPAVVRSRVKLQLRLWLLLPLLPRLLGCLWVTRLWCPTCRMMSRSSKSG